MAARIAALLHDPDPLVRESAVRIAGYFGYPECLERVLQCCRDRWKRCAGRRSSSLAFFDDPRVVPALVDALAATVAHGPRRGCGRAGAHRAAGGASMRLHARSATRSWVRYVALRSLGSIGDRPRRPGRARHALRTGPCAARSPRGDRCARPAASRPRPGTCSSRLPVRSDSDIGGAAIRALGHVERSGGAVRARRVPSRRREPWQRDRGHGRGHNPVRRDDVAEPPAMGGGGRRRHGRGGAAIDGLAKIARRQDRQGAEAARALVALTAEPLRREAAIAALERPAGPATSPTSRAAFATRRPTSACASVEALGRMQQPDASRALERRSTMRAAAVRLAAIAR